MLSARGRIELDRDPVTWMEDSFESLDIELLPLTPAVAVLAAQFQTLQGDPADREKLQASDLVRTRW